MIQEIRLEYDMLHGNINRICVGQEYQEIEIMHEWAIKRLEKLKQLNIERLNNKI